MPTTYTPGEFGRFTATDVIAVYVVSRLWLTGSALLVSPPVPFSWAPLHVVGGAVFVGAVMLVVGTLLGISYLAQKHVRRRSPELFLSAIAAASVYVMLAVIFVATLRFASVAGTLPTALMAFWLAAEGRPPWRVPPTIPRVV